MSYEKTVWTKGDKITSEKLNKLEDGVVNSSGAQGATGATGADGVRGSRFFPSNNVTGESTNGTVFANSGISDALVYDYCINKDTGSIYVCSKGGDASVAEWKYNCNIKGDKGDTGATGLQGIQGETGDKGDKGDKGANGSPGVNGVGIRTITGSISGNDLTLVITLTDESVQNVTVTLPTA